jgi:hypothetical protein
MRGKLRNMINRSSMKRGPGNDVMESPDAPRGALSLQRKSENGVVLLMVLILSAIALAIMTALIYMITIGTQTSGMQKRYRTALEAGIAGSDVLAQVIEARGDISSLTALSPNITVPAACTGTSINSGVPYTGIQTKIMTSMTGTSGTANWSASCNSYLKTDPTNSTTYDLTFNVGNNPQYTVYAKIVDTVEGNTGGAHSSGSNLHSKGVVATYGSGEIEVMSIPYLYTIEIDAENASSSSKERAKLQVLYQN